MAGRRGAALAAAALLLWCAPAPAAAPCAALCTCRGDHLACDAVPFHRFPDTEAGVRHVAVSAARLGALGAAALDARALRTLVLVGDRLHHIEPTALASMVSTLASLDLGYNEFTEIPADALRELKVLNWLNLQNNYIGSLEAEVEWGALAESLSSLSLANNHLCVLRAGALSALRRLVQLDLEGNRLHALAAGALPPALALLRLSDNLLAAPPCAALQRLPRLRHLHLRHNLLHPLPALNGSCRAERTRFDLLDLSQNELDDSFTLDFQPRLQLQHLILDLNDFTSIPAFVADGGRLERLSMTNNRLSHISDATLHALARDLRRLELDHNKLVALGAGVRALVRLRHLSLAYNRLEELAHLPPRLESLALAGNRLARLPMALRHLEPAALRHLDVGYNYIAVVTARDFGPWADALETLSLKGNRLAALRVDVFPATLPLRELALAFNELDVLEARALANLTRLRVLDLSTALVGGDFFAPAGLEILSWLSLDNNDIHRVSIRDLENFSSLEYLNLDFNKIVEFPSDAIEARKVEYRLKELRLSYNYISKINVEFLANLVELQTLDLSYNRLTNISDRSFANLPNLMYLSLAANLVENVAMRAFRHLPRLQALDLSDNHLLEFSAHYFENVSSDDDGLSVNVSCNRIATLFGGDSSVRIAILDLSHNLLESLATAFFEAIGPHIRQLMLSYNRLAIVDGASFASLPNLQMLKLNDNRLVTLRRRAFAEMPSLQILDLSRNAIQQLSVEQFSGLRNLRHLRLDRNELRALSRDCFKNTLLEHLDLGDNRLALFPSSALAQVGFTLRRLELVGNRLEHLDAAMFHATTFLHELSLARNVLTALADNTFAGLPRLRQLDLSGNALKANFKELFGSVPRLRRLALADTGLRAVPPLPLPELAELDLAGNGIAAFREPDVRRLIGLRALDLAGNRFTALQPAMWTALPHLSSLDVSANPIVRISRGSFEGLGHLLWLKLERLRHLEAVEPRAFRSLSALRSLSVESPLGRGRASLADVTAATRGLEALTVTVRSAALDAQLLGVAAPRLRALEVRGVALRRVVAHAFSALGQQRALALRLRGTGVMALPDGLAHPLALVPHLALDFSDNRLVSFSPAVLYPNITDWSRPATKFLPGGLVVSESGLRCGCGVTWLGAWLRRWAAEVGGWSAGARAAARASRCAGAVPLVALHADAAACRASALSSRAPAPRPAPHPAHSLWLVLLYALR